jgi:hypothetical protein
MLDTQILQISLLSHTALRSQLKMSPPISLRAGTFLGAFLLSGLSVYLSVKLF